MGTGMPRPCIMPVEHTGLACHRSPHFQSPFGTLPFGTGPFPAHDYTAMQHIDSRDHAEMAKKHANHERAA
jgi:hypothetical protein